MNQQIKPLQKWLILFNVSISVFMATLDASIVNIALPVISRELSVNISSVQWVVTSYLLTISVLLLIWGKISDMYGRKRVFAFGFFIFTIGSGFCGLAQSLGFLVFSRILQATGASAMMALSQGIVTSSFPPHERGRALGIIGTTVAVGSLVGPSLGGVLVHLAGWQSIFFINLPVGVMGVLLTFLIIPDFLETYGNRIFDYQGAGLFSGAILFMFLGLLLLQENAIGVEVFLAMMAGALLSFFFFIKREKRTASPLINLQLFHNPVFSMGILSAYLSFVALFSTILFIPFFLQFVLKMDALAAGLLISFNPATSAIVAPFSGWLSDKITYRPLTVAGLITNTVTLFIIATLNPSSHYALIAVLMACLGLGSAVFQSPNNSSVMGSVPKEHLGVAGGIVALFRNLGMVSGATLSVLLFTFTTKMNINSFSDAAVFDTVTFMRGFRIVILFAASCCLLGAIISLTRSVGLTYLDKKQPLKES